MKFMKPLSLLAGVALSALAIPAHAQTFQNGSFESGTLDGWTVGGGYWPGGLYPVPEDYLPTGTNYDPSYIVAAVTNAGFDPYTDNILRTVYAGDHSAQVNDSYNNNSVTVLSQRVNGYSENLIAFAYAAVLQSSHDTYDSDAFIITLKDATTNEILYSYNLNSATAPGVFTQSSLGWFYSDWLTQSVDVSDRLGHDFILSLLANDCPYGGHAGYAYLDGFGSVEGGGGTGGGTDPILLFWDGDGATSAANLTVDGGDGTWTATKGNWTEGTGALNGHYNPNPGGVVFTGAPGTVTVDDGNGAIGVTGMTFLTSGYHILGDDIGLSGNAAIQVGDGTPESAGWNTLISSSLTGTGGLQKTDLGTLILDGNNTFTGATEVAAGRLLVHGDTSGSLVTVDSGAVLGGYGTVGGITALDGSVVAPGASIGTLTVTGGYTAAATSTYEVELQSTGENDRLTITGTAVVDPGAVLHVTKLDPSRYVLGTRYTVLSAEGGLTGTYSLTGDTRVSYFINLVDHYDASHVYLDVAQTRSFESAGSTPNQKAAGGAADTGSGELFTALAYLQTLPEAQDAFDQISGEVHATYQAAAIEDSRFIRDAITDRLTSGDTGGRAGWFRVFGSKADLDGDGNAASAERSIGGVFLGSDFVQHETWRAGFVLGFDHSKIKVFDRASSGESNDIHLGGYVGTSKAVGWGARGGVAYTHRDVETNRNIAFAGFSNHLTSDYGSQITQVFGDVGYRHVRDNWTVEPFASAAFVQAKLEDAKEGGGTAALTLPSQDTHITFATVGVRGTARLSSKDGKPVDLRAMVGYRAADGDLDSPALANFAASNRYTVLGTPIDKGALVMDVGVDAKIGPRTDLSIAYSGVVGDTMSDHGAKATLRFRF